MSSKYRWYEYNKTLGNNKNYSRCIEICNYLNNGRYIGSTACRICKHNRGSKSNAIKCKYIDKATNGKFKNKAMTPKEMLKPGMITVDCNGTIGIVFKNSIISKQGGADLNDYSENLNRMCDSEHTNSSINEIYDIPNLSGASIGHWMKNLNNVRSCTSLLWKRDIKIEITCKINDKPAKLSDISEETLIKLRNENK